jgi:CubicO group peptidase (beta-lactamase class C family)
MPYRSRTCVALVLLFSLALSGLAAAALPCDIPRLDGLTVDGKADDWGTRGFRVEAMVANDGSAKPLADLDCTFRLGWNDAGLLLLAVVHDNLAAESDSTENLYFGDSLELFVSPAADPAARRQVVLGPGFDPKTPNLRTKAYDSGGAMDLAVPVQAARTITDGGYIMEVLFPWADLPLTPKEGAEIYFNLWANDFDPPGAGFQAFWPPRASREVPNQATHRLRLSRQASPAVSAAAVSEYERLRRARIRVRGTGALAGVPVEVRSGRKTLARATFAPDAGRAAASLTVPLPAPGQPMPDLAVYVKGAELSPVELPELASTRARTVIEMPFEFHPAVFSSAAFPSCDFDEPSLAEDALGPYTIKTSFYNAAYQPATTADKPGRYGAVVQVVPASGRSLTYFRTVFRLPDGAGLWSFPRNPSVDARLPSLPGLDPAVLKANAVAVNDAFQGSLAFAATRSSSVAALLAGLYEAKPSDAPVTAQNDVFAQDRQWWVTLKRKLYGLEDAYPAGLVSPRPKEGAPATVLHAGTLAEAGMAPDTVDKLDALLTKWAAETDQAFAVFIARHGVIVMDKAYGERDGRPMTVDDKSWMASLTKLLAGTCLMMAVDQGRVNLDDPVAKYLPAFRDVEVPRPLVVRNLSTHTGGLWGHWGDEMPDFDQLIGYYYPYLQVGRRYEYDGAGPALASKILELVTGEALPLFYQHHLLEPLGLVNLDATTSSWDARSTAHDFAVIGQMLLNGGAYGGRRYLSEAAVQQMKPAKVTKMVPTDTSTEYGIGTEWFRNEGLAEGTFAHGAASSATLRIDPADDLVVAMTRNDAGRYFHDYHARFMRTIASCLTPAK